jgi:hypothetical protein
MSKRNEQLFEESLGNNISQYLKISLFLVNLIGVRILILHRYSDLVSMYAIDNISKLWVVFHYMEGNKNIGHATWRKKQTSNKQNE